MTEYNHAHYEHNYEHNSEHRLDYCHERNNEQHHDDYHEYNNERSHEHHHHTKPQFDDPLHVEIHPHEGALAASYSFSVPGNTEETQEKLTKFYHGFAAMLHDNGAHIGHLKGTATPQGSCSFYSVTAHSVGIQTIAQQDVLLQGVAIVFAISPDRLQKLLENAYHLYILGEQ